MKNLQSAWFIKYITYAWLQQNKNWSITQAFAPLLTCLDKQFGTSWLRSWQTITSHTARKSCSRTMILSRNDYTTRLLLLLCYDTITDDSVQSIVISSKCGCIFIYQYADLFLLILSLSFVSHADCQLLPVSVHFIWQSPYLVFLLICDFWLRYVHIVYADGFMYVSFPAIFIYYCSKQG